MASNATTDTTLSLYKRDKYIKQMTKQINETQKMISSKMDEIRLSKKDNPMLEGIYNETVNNVKQSKKKIVDALSNLATYLSKLKVDDDNKKEKEKDIQHVMHEIRKHK
jgi:hypothetical protein